MCRYSEIKDYTFGQEPCGGPVTGDPSLWDDCLYFSLNQLKLPFMLVCCTNKCLFLSNLSLNEKMIKLNSRPLSLSRALQPSSLEGQHTTWCWSCAKRWQGLSSSSPQIFPSLPPWSPQSFGYLPCAKKERYFRIKISSFKVGICSVLAHIDQIWPEG